jgi:N-acetylmuramoyl-L-alanine amidase
MRARSIAAILCLLAFFTEAPSAEQGLTVKGVRFFSYSGFTRVVFEIESAAPYVATRQADGKSLSFSAYEGDFSLTTQLPAVNDGVVAGMELRREGGRSAVVILLGPAAGEVKDFVLRSPDRIVLDIMRGTPPRSAPPAARPFIIVLDPGHGGAEAGIVTAQGLEKTVTMELALAVRKMLMRQQGVTVLLTREKDQALSLEERAAFSNASGAALFVSIHAAPGADAKVFILDPDEGRAVEPRGARSDFLGFDAVSDQQQMLWGAQQAEHAQESGNAGRDILRALGDGEGREPVQAPIALLRAVDAPALLVEAGAGRGRARLAEELASGIEQYVREKR